MARLIRALAPAAALLLAVAPGSALAADTPAERLAEAIRFRTISHQDPARFDPEPFFAFHAWVERSYPAVHRLLQREIVNGYSLLYTFRGADLSLPAILLTSHHDVVPVSEDQLAAWEQPPFGGVIADGFVWGRGAIDDKVGVVCMLEAVERLAAEGFVPRRTVYLAFGHDEELGGPAGAGATAALLAEREVRLWFSLDEGMAIVDGALFGVPRELAMIGIAEKGSLTLELTARAPGGHSSTPPPSTAIGRLAGALRRVEQSPLPARLSGASEAMLDALAAEMPFPRSFLLGQRWLTEPILLRYLAADQATNAMIRTTTAVTMVEGGVKANVLPTRATGTVNFRLLPGDSVDDVTAHVRRAVADDEIQIRAATAREASPVADVDSDSYRLLADTLTGLGRGIAVAPALVLGGTDSKHYVGLAENSYRFTPMTLGRGDMTRIHGNNERIAAADLERVVDFYVALLRNANQVR